MTRQHAAVQHHTDASYSRAVRVGNHVLVSGTAGTDEHGQVVGNDVEAQMRRCIAIIEQALIEVGAALTDVVRTRVLLTHLERDWQVVMRVHAERFGAIRPAAIMYEVNRFADPALLIEMEVDALIDHDA